MIAATTAAATVAAKSSAFTIFWPGKTSGRPGSSSWSLPNATMLPENEIEPITAENMIPTTTSPVQVVRERREAMELGRGDQRRRAAADAVEDRDHLRHRGHAHHARRRESR